MEGGMEGGGEGGREAGRKETSRQGRMRSIYGRCSGDR